MRKIRILGIYSHFKLKDDKNGNEVCHIGPVDFYRIQQPLTYLSKNKFEVDLDYEIAGKNGRFKTMEEYAKYYDILYLSYIDTVKYYIEMKVLGIKHGMKIIMDLDDNIWSVDPTHPFYKNDFEPESENTFNRMAILLDSDGLTTTNSYLRYEMSKKLKRPVDDIKIFPNYIDLNEFDTSKVKRIKDDKFVIGYLGGSSHLPDMTKPEFIKALRIIMDKYPQVRFRTCFYMPQLKANFGYKYEYEIIGSGERYRHEGWPKMMSQFDVTVAPLVDTNYSKSKSYVKYLEYSLGKLPSICEDIGPYRQVISGTERGFLAHSTEDWVNHLSYLIENPEKRLEIGENAYNYVKENHTIQKGIKLYEDYFTKIFNSSVDSSDRK